MAYREFKDDVGAAWRVWDTYPETRRHVVMPSLLGGWLTFEHDNARRRLVPAPVGWVEADDDQLRSWLAASTPVTRRIQDVDLPTSIPVVSDRAPAPPGPAPLPEFTDDLRRLLERSRETIETINRAISRGSAPVDEPSTRPGEGERG